MDTNSQLVGIIPKEFKPLTCQADFCANNDCKAGCGMSYIELDEHGICIHFIRKDNGERA